MTAGQLFQAGKLDQAVQALGVELRDNPGDVQRRTFLFELLCFAGAYDRAEKQLDVLAQGGKDAQLGALLYAARCTPSGPGRISSRKKSTRRRLGNRRRP